MTSLAYHYGYIAGQRGLGERANPYPANTYEWVKWNEGNLQAWAEQGDFDAGCV